MPPTIPSASPAPSIPLPSERPGPTPAGALQSGLDDASRVVVRDACALNTWEDP